MQPQDVYREQGRVPVPIDPRDSRVPLNLPRLAELLDERDKLAAQEREARERLRSTSR